MNVLVYAGPEVVQASLSRSISILKRLLVPNYTVQAITPQSLSSQPWSSTGALLVIPACNQKLSLSTTTSNTIRSFVEGGGALLGLRAGISSSPLESGLRFQDAASGVNLTCNFHGDEPSGAYRFSVSSSQGELSGTTSGRILDIDTVESSSLQILSLHSDNSKPAAVVFRSGMGRVSLWSVPLEVDYDSDEQGEDRIKIIQNRQTNLICETLRLLGIQLPSDTPSDSLLPLPLILTGSPSRPEIVQNILTSLSLSVPGTLDDENDNFEFIDIQHGLNTLHRARSEQIEFSTKPVIVFKDGMLPSSVETPLFDLAEYHSALSTVRKELDLSESSPWGIGEALQYGEVVTSTQTMLDK